LHAAAAAVILMCLLGWIGIRVHARP